MRALSPVATSVRAGKTTTASASVRLPSPLATLDEPAETRSADDAMTAAPAEPTTALAAVPHRPDDGPVLAGALTPNDDRLTTVNASTRSVVREQPAAALPHPAREHAIETASRAADRHAIARGVHAEIELGDAGRVHVHASRPDERIHVRLDADAASTARMLGEHAGELARELRANVHDARVTVSGPTTHATATSDGSARGDRGEGSSARREEHPALAQNDDGAPARPAAPAARSARARFVL